MNFISLYLIIWRELKKKERILINLRRQKKTINNKFIDVSKFSLLEQIIFNKNIL